MESCSSPSAIQTGHLAFAEKMGPDDQPINGTDLDRHVEAMLRDQSLPGHIRAVMAMLLEDQLAACKP
ncbi:hypothetical protein Q1695_011801 [Nippostrongylus brasiliensis]|nr:hypothetical protein Q1695_011801 [Nippostrongylus brasiliensis]